jgi:hypothetical protein
MKGETGKGRELVVGAYVEGNGARWIRRDRVRDERGRLIGRRTGRPDAEHLCSGRERPFDEEPAFSDEQPLGAQIAVAKGEPRSVISQTVS